MHADAPQAATVGTSQAEHVIFTDTPLRHSISVIPVVDLDDNHISGGVPPDGYEIGRIDYRDESNIWKPQGAETMYGGHVRNWTKDVNLFEKKYIFIPINQSSHWSLIIICNPASLSYEQISSPCILHLDSLKDRYLDDIVEDYSRNHLVEAYIRQYIIEAWKEKYQAGSDDGFRSLCSIMKFVQAEVPQQENGSNCGIYLLHYIERFLQELEVSSNLEFALMDHTLPTDRIPGIWFESSEVSMKRKEIEYIIISLSQETSTCMGDKAAQFAATKPSQEQACTSLSRPKREEEKE